MRYLVAICKDLGHKYDHYQASLAKLERAAAAKTGGGLAKGILTQAGAGQQAASRGHQARGGHQPGADHGGGGGARRIQQQVPPPIQEENSGMSNSSNKARDFEAAGQHGNLQSQRRKNNLNDSDEFDDADIDDLLA